MSTLREEREAIVEEIGQLFADCFVNKARSWGEIKKDIDTAILSHEEKVMERVKKRMVRGINDFRITDAKPPFYKPEIDIVATKEAREAMRFLKKYTFKELTLPITDENV